MKQNGAVLDTVPLAFAGKPSMFEGKVEVSGEGPYEVTVFAYDQATGNTGVDKTGFTISKK